MSADTEPTERPWQDPDTLKRLYVDEELDMATVADRLGCAKPTVARWLKRHDIETRGSGRRNVFTDAELLEHLRTVHADTAYRVTVTDVDAVEGPSHQTYTERFGSFDAALEAAGIDPDAPTQPTAYRDTLEIGQGDYLVKHPDVARELARADPPLRRRELDISRSAFHKLLSWGVLTPASDRPLLDSEIENSYSWEWELADGVAAWIDHNVDPAGECPEADCEATGVRNLGDGEFTCTDEDCSSRFGRETAREVLGG